MQNTIQCYYNQIQKLPSFKALPMLLVDGYCFWSSMCAYTWDKISGLRAKSNSLDPEQYNHKS